MARLIGAAARVRSSASPCLLLVCCRRSRSWCSARPTGRCVERCARRGADAVAPVARRCCRARSRGRRPGRRQRRGIVADLRAENARLRERECSGCCSGRRRRAGSTHENARAARAARISRRSRRPAYVTARVIGDSGGAFVRSVLVNAGARDGVAQGPGAITGEGLVGRVTEVGERVGARPAAHRPQLAHAGADRAHARAGDPGRRQLRPAAACSTVAPRPSVAGRRPHRHLGRRRHVSRRAAGRRRRARRRRHGRASRRSSTATDWSIVRVVDYGAAGGLLLPVRRAPRPAGAAAAGDGPR